MNIGISWEELLEQKTRFLSDYYLTDKQFDEIIEELLAHPRSPLSGLQYIIPANSPFSEFRYGREFSGQPDVNTINLNDNRDTECQIRHWRKATTAGSNDEIIEPLKELFKSYWKEELRTESAGMIDIKRSTEANAIAEATLKYHFGNNQICSLLFCDLDNFGQVNTKYSHSEGDRIIKEFGAIIENIF